MVEWDRAAAVDAMLLLAKSKSARPCRYITVISWRPGGLVYPGAPQRRSTVVTTARVGIVVCIDGGIGGGSGGGGVVVVRGCSTIPSGRGARL